MDRYKVIHCRRPMMVAECLAAEVNPKLLDMGIEVKEEDTIWMPIMIFLQDIEVVTPNLEEGYAVVKLLFMDGGLTLSINFESFVKIIAEYYVITD